jgi:hypothetical protein
MCGGEFILYIPIMIITEHRLQGGPIRKAQALRTPYETA